MRAYLTAALLGILGTPPLLARRAEEERLLAGKFGDEYAAYRARTWARRTRTERRHDMRNAQELADDIERALEGDPWFGPSALSVLADVDAAQALARPEAAKHSIWEIVLHMTSWARYVTYRAEGGAPCDPADGDWPGIDATDDDAWAAALADLRRRHTELVDILRGLPDEALDAVYPNTPCNAQDEPITLRRAVMGIAEHAAYHAGQITVLKRV